MFHLFAVAKQSQGISEHPCMGSRAVRTPAPRRACRSKVRRTAGNILLGMCIISQAALLSIASRTHKVDYECPLRWSSWGATTLRATQSAVAQPGAHQGPLELRLEHSQSASRANRPPKRQWDVLRPQHPGA